MPSADPNVPKKPSLLRAVLDAILGEDDRLAGASVTKLTAALSAAELTTINVETTQRFGYYLDVALNGEPSNDGMLIINGEIIYCLNRSDTTFLDLTRGLEGSLVQAHPPGTLVYDYSQNRSAVDLVRRAFLVRFAQGPDLDVIGRNLGVPKCPGLTDDEWRQLIQATAYMPKQPLDSFRKVLDIVYPNRYEIIRKPSEPWTVRVNIQPEFANTKKGKFLLNGGEPRLSTSNTTVVTVYPINQITSVIADTQLARMGFPGPDLYAGGSFVGQTITLGTPVSGAGVPLIVNYGTFAAHYLAADDTVVEHNDYFAYLSDASSLAACLLDHVRAAGIKIKVGIKK